jgi:hypothetical protein
MRALRFLQSTSSNMVISEDEAVTEHCVSALACLLCGVDVFFGTMDRHSKALRVVKGIHGFHVYATDYWTEYLLHYVKENPAGSDSTVLRLGMQLADRLDECGYATTHPAQDSHALPADDRLGLLVDWPLLSNIVATSLRARSLKRLESNLMQEFQQCLETTDDTMTTALPRPGEDHGDRSERNERRDGISTMLHMYQEIVKDLLKQDQYPGISADDLGLFKSQFQSSAFTCRLSFCPRATVGFASEEQRRQHEIAHTQLCICTVPECRYPPFNSTKNLQSHINKYHRPQPTRRPIRRMRSQIFRKWTDHDVDSELQENSAEDSPDHLGSHDTPKKRHAKGQKEVHTRQHGRVPVISSTASGPGVGAVGECERGDACNHDEILNVPIESIGYRGCAIPGCEVRLISGIGEGSSSYSSETHEYLSFHYWNWHHADPTAQCAVSRCQMRFASSQGLQAHYEHLHTALFCERCDDNHPDGFALEDELRYHWRSHHLTLVDKWICADLTDGRGQLPPPALSFEACESCTKGVKFDRRYDAIKHLGTVHYDQPAKALHGPFSRNLESGVRMVRIYEAIRSNGSWATDQSDGADDDDPNSEWQDHANKLYYVEDLA